MDVKPGCEKLFILCCTFLIVVTISCNSQGQSNSGNKKVQVNNNTQFPDKPSHKAMLSFAVLHLTKTNQ